MTDLSDFGRDLAFRWRSFARVSAPPWKRVAGNWDGVDAVVDAKGLDRLRRLRTQHGDAMARWPGILTSGELREAAYVLDLLLDVGVATPRPHGPSLDVGTKNGSNLPAFAAFAEGPWDLVEIDAHRRYAGPVARQSSKPAHAVSAAAIRLAMGSANVRRTLGSRRRNVG